MATIPASQLVNYTPGVLGAGGSALALNAIILTTNTRVPIGGVTTLANDGVSVSNFFGGSSDELKIANIYFSGFDNSTKKPASIMFAQYPLTAVAAWLRTGKVSGLTLAQLQALSGTLSITVDGTVETSSTINLSAATSFSNAATLIQAGFTAPTFAVTYDSVSGAFVFTATATGATSTITAATGTLAAGIYATVATGATLSQGADAAVPGTFMTALTQVTQNWVSFMHMFDPDAGSGNAQKLLFSEWTNSQNDRYAYVARDTDITPTESNNAASSLGQLLKAGDYSGTILIYNPSTDEAQAKDAVICGIIASIDTLATNGRITLAFKGQDGQVADVTDATVANNLIANGYNFYGAYATANQAFNFLQPGQISGPFAWADSYVNQIWLNNALQLAWMNLLAQINSLPYNDQGTALVKAAAMDPISAALNFGAIRAGVALSASQIAQINNAAGGVNAAAAVQSQGWYLLVQTAAAQVRAARTTPPITFWYADGGSIQQLDFASIEVQ